MTHGILAFTQVELILPLGLIGYIFYDRRIFIDAFCLVMLSVIVNVVLKVIFQVPLASHLGEGYAFPSGHMQSTSVFYLYIMLGLRQRIFTVVISLLLAALAVSLYICNYHNVMDIVFGLLFACMLIWMYHCLSSFSDGVRYGAIISASSFLMLYIDCRYPMIKPYVWMAYYGLWGVAFAQFFIDEKKHYSMRVKCSALIFSCVVCCMIQYLFSSYLAMTEMFIYQTQWFFMSSLMILSLEIVRACDKRIKRLEA